jgi:transposase
VRYELSDSEWAAIKPFLPNKSPGVRRVNDRRVLNGIFWVLRSGAPWRDVSFGGEGPEYGAGLWAHLPPLMMRPSK